jgi:hypothetical protein
MSKQWPIAYEPHPVAPERKAELRAAGYRIIDAVFMPQGHQNPAAESSDPEGAKKATVAELRDALTAKGVEIPEGAKKADLQALLDAA